MKKKSVCLLVLLLLFSTTACKDTETKVENSFEPKVSESKNVKAVKEESAIISDNNEFTSVISESDNLLFRIDNKYLLCKKESATWIPDDTNTKYGIRNYQYFLSSDETRIFYNTDQAGQSGRLFYYDINKKQHIDLLNELGIKIDGHISLISYNKNNNKIICLLGKSNGNDKIETNNLLEIDVSNKTHKITKAPFDTRGTNVNNGLSYLNNDILLPCPALNSIQISEQHFKVIDNQGVEKNDFVIKENDMICNISASDDGKYFSYQLGMTPASLYLYDFDNKSKKVIFDSDKIYKDSGKNVYCIGSCWGKDGEILYYITYQLNNENKAQYTLNKFHVED